MPAPISLHERVVILVNLGTPSHATPGAVGRYLREFLSDPRVVEIPALFWKPLLYGIIVPLRARQSAKNYASIWTDQGSPLALHHHQLAQALQQQFDQTHQKISILAAMRYAERSEQSPHLHLQDALIQCEKAGVKVNCLKCYTNNTTEKVFVYDTCVLEGQRSWRDENINCYIK